MLHNLLALSVQCLRLPQLPDLLLEARLTACGWLPCRVATLDSCTAGAARPQPGLVSSSNQAQSAGVPQDGHLSPPKPGMQAARCGCASQCGATLPSSRVTSAHDAWV